MNATVDLDDPEGLLAADRNGLLRSASMAGAQMRSVATAVSEGALDTVRADFTGVRPRAVIWVGGRGPAATAGAILAGALADSMTTPFVVASRAPAWTGPLDVMVVAGDDAGDPALSAAAALGTRRGTQVIIAAPDEGPLADSAGGRALSLAPRLPVPDAFGLGRFLAVGLATLGALDTGGPVDLPAIADEVDGEVSRNTVSREVFTNAAKALAARLTNGPVVLCGDRPATVALARHGAATVLRLTSRVIGGVSLADALAAASDAELVGNSSDSIFHDEFIDGPRGDVPPRVLALVTDVDQQAVGARIAKLDEAHLVETTDLGPGALRPTEISQLTMLAVRMEMAAVYARLGAGAV